MKGVTTGVRTTRCYARCLDCRRAWDGPNSLAVAARHAAAFGHTTFGDRQTSHTYQPSYPSKETR